MSTAVLNDVQATPKSKTTTTNAKLLCAASAVSAVTPTQKQLLASEKKMGVTSTKPLNGIKIKEKINVEKSHLENVNVGCKQNDVKYINNNEVPMPETERIVTVIKCEAPADSEETNHSIGTIGTERETTTAVVASVVTTMMATATDTARSTLNGVAMLPPKYDEALAAKTTCTSNNGKEPYAEAPKIRLTPTSKLLATKPIMLPAMATIGPVSAVTSTSQKRRYCCPYENCTKSYGKSSHLRSHVTWHTGIKPFVCQELNCGKGFTRSDELNRHMRTHTGEKPFECKQCSKRFSRSDHLSKHVATHTKNAANALVMKREGNYSAPPPHLIEFRDAGQRSKRNADGPLVSSDSALSPKRQSPCDFQGLHFMAALINNTNNRLTQTANSAGQRSSNESPIQGNLDLKTERSTPPKLRNVAASSDAEDDCFDNEIMPEANVPLFINTVDVQAVATTAKCRPTHLHEERPYPCSECEKRFRRQEDLNRHRRTHTGEKPYSCNECDRRFCRSDHLKKHKNTHLKNR